MSDLTQAEKQNAKLKKAIDSATVDGRVTVRVTLIGEGCVDTGELSTNGMKQTFNAEDTFETTAKNAFELTVRGLVEPMKPKAKAK